MAGIIMSQQQMCEVLRVSRPTITKYVKLGMPIISRGKYDVGAGVAWFVEHQKRLSEIGQDSTPTNDNPETRLILARTLKLEMENAEKQRDLIPWQEFSAFIMWYTTLVTNGFESIGARLGTILASIDEPAEIQAQIHKEGRIIRRLLSNKLKKADLLKILPNDNEPVKNS